MEKDEEKLLGEMFNTNDEITESNKKRDIL